MNRPTFTVKKHIYYLYFTSNIESNDISKSDQELNNDLYDIEKYLK